AALLELLQDWLEVPMLVLAFIWLALFVIEVIWGLSPLVDILGYVIWAVFLLQFVVEFTLAPVKRRYLQYNWLTAISLAAPALRVLRVARLVRLARVTRTASVVR